MDLTVYIGCCLKHMLFNEHQTSLLNVNDIYII